MSKITTIEAFYESITDVNHQKTIKEVVDWILVTFPNLTLEIKWNQPFFVLSGTFIIAFSVSKNHFGVAPMQEVNTYFKDEIILSGYETTSNMFRIKFKEDVNYHLLKRIILYTIDLKKDQKKFW